MPQIEFGENYVYHIYNRGASKLPIFRGPDDYQDFQDILRYLLTGFPIGEVSQTSRSKPLIEKLHLPISYNADPQGNGLFKPFYNEAWAFLGELIAENQVRIEYDRVQNDNYGRLRGYAFIPCSPKFQDYCQNGEINVNIAIVRAGMARVKNPSLWQKPKYQAELKQAEEIAKTFLLGLWGGD